MTAKIDTDQHVDIHSIVPLPGNPRRGDVDAVARSLRRFGQAKPIVVSRETREVIAGNHTHAAALQLGWERIWVAWFDGTPEEARAYAAADNRTHDLGSYDDAALAALLSSVAAVGDAELLAATSYDDADIAALLAGGAPGSADYLEVPDTDNYVEQYGVTVLCSDASEQERIFDRLSAEGLNVRVVTV